MPPMNLPAVTRFFVGGRIFIRAMSGNVFELYPNGKMSEHRIGTLEGTRRRGYTASRRKANRNMYQSAQTWRRASLAIAWMVQAPKNEA